MPDDVQSRVGALETHVAVLETKMATMEGVAGRIAEAQEATAKDVRAIRELIATGRGAWWAGATLLAFMAALAGGAGALVHKFSSGQ